MQVVTDRKLESVFPSTDPKSQNSPIHDLIVNQKFGYTHLDNPLCSGTYHGSSTKRVAYGCDVPHFLFHHRSKISEAYMNESVKRIPFTEIQFQRPSYHVEGEFETVVAKEYDAFELVFSFHVPGIRRTENPNEPVLLRNTPTDVLTPQVLEYTHQRIFELYNRIQEKYMHDDTFYDIELTTSPVPSINNYKTPSSVKQYIDSITILASSENAPVIQEIVSCIKEMAANANGIIPKVVE